jgi:hypothetical protein
MPNRQTTHLGLAGVVLLIASVGAGCAAAINPLQVEAAQTAARVKTALVNDPRVGIRAIEVRVRDGVAVLAGQVASAEEATHAVAVAQRVPGVTRVESRLTVGPIDPAPGTTGAPDAVAGDRAPDEVRGVAAAFAELEDPHDLLAAGAAVRVVNPRGEAQGTRWQISPIVRLGNRRGLGPAIAFDWYSAEPRATARIAGDVGRVRVRPIMAGLRYTVPMGRWSLAPSVVGGVAINGLKVAEAGDVERLSVGVANSMAWRTALSLWYETSRRTALHASIGRVFTRPRFTVVEDGLLRDRRANADATILLVGVACKVF